MACSWGLGWVGSHWKPMGNSVAQLCIWGWDLAACNGGSLILPKQKKKMLGLGKPGGPGTQGMGSYGYGFKLGKVFCGVGFDPKLWFMSRNSWDDSNSCSIISIGSCGCHGPFSSMIYWMTTVTFHSSLYCQRLPSTASRRDADLSVPGPMVAFFLSISCCFPNSVS